ncbi:hypothetical protein MHU86_7622 [Fragilaria crotonensis]|nr:hypothetical protein MHU86_7622 [Fragilaria crotonensis]
MTPPDEEVPQEEATPTELSRATRNASGSNPIDPSTNATSAPSSGPTQDMVSAPTPGPTQADTLATSQEVPQADTPYSTPNPTQVDTPAPTPEPTQGDTPGPSVTEIQVDMNPPTSVLTQDPSPAETTVTPVQIACNFLSIASLIDCQRTVVFDSSFASLDRPSGLTIPSELGLLTQLTYLRMINTYYR